jgi:hypothetical protein
MPSIIKLISTLLVLYAKFFYHQFIVRDASRAAIINKIKIRFRNSLENDLSSME